MFRDFANVWTVATAQRLRRDAPLAVTVAGERVVFFRDREGIARALLDRCPHRGARLSLGAVREGCITCPFHGWTFAGDGATELPTELAGSSARRPGNPRISHIGCSVTWS